MKANLEGGIITTIQPGPLIKNEGETGMFVLADEMVRYYRLHIILVEKKEENYNHNITVLNCELSFPLIEQWEIQNIIPNMLSNTSVIPKNESLGLAEDTIILV